MARIRSIKPEFWRDAKIAALPKATALFFIALWNFADDQGIVEADTRQLSLDIPIYRSQDIEKMLNALWKSALIMRSPIDGLVLIKSWHHQKIDRPRDGKWKDRDINWLTHSDSTMPRDQSTQGSRIGSGKDRIGVPVGETAPPPDPEPVQTNLPIPSGPPPPPAPGVQQLIAFYCRTWSERHGGTKPPRPSGKDQGNLKTLLKDHGFEGACRLIEAYFQMPDPLFAQRSFDLGTLMLSRTKVHLFAESGRMISRREASQLDDAVAAANLKRQIREGGV